MKLTTAESSAIASTWEALMTWLNPARRERATLLRAIEAAEQLFLIYEQQGRYAEMTDIQLLNHKRHYRRQFDSWKDGKG